MLVTLLSYAPFVALIALSLLERTAGLRDSHAELAGRAFAFAAPVSGLLLAFAAMRNGAPAQIATGILAGLICLGAFKHAGRDVAARAAAGALGVHLIANLGFSGIVPGILLLGLAWQLPALVDRIEALPDADGTSAAEPAGAGGPAKRAAAAALLAGDDDLPARAVGRATMDNRAIMPVAPDFDAEAGPAVASMLGSVMAVAPPAAGGAAAAPPAAVEALAAPVPAPAAPPGAAPQALERDTVRSALPLRGTGGLTSISEGAPEPLNAPAPMPGGVFRRYRRSV